MNHKRFEKTSPRCMRHMLRASLKDITAKNVANAERKKPPASLSAVVQDERQHYAHRDDADENQPPPKSWVSEQHPGQSKGPLSRAGE